ncbi:SNF2 family N-terminal domain-containing protein [Russula earlei]|uniref:SNF2 family N-terminal domain-containing protein n=1 Tax=Russula earlei TaxID=71964 RepID=A0ACC0U868_9AGAM|nr:SNF2 family N-terminal domain-containing protein [Russula earlei]
MSLGQNAAAKRNAALDQLRFKKKQKASAVSQGTSTPPSTSSMFSSESRSLVSMPAQSRDATARTLPSRFFTPASKTNGTVLVPSSSPLSTPPSAGQINPTQHNEPAPTLSLAGIDHGFARDPLSVPSGFINGSKPADASPVSVTGFVRPRGDDDAFDAPPCKRTRPPTSDDSLDLFNVPDSPIVQKPGQRRAPVATRTANPSTSSDESVLDTSVNSSRIVRGARPADRSATDTIDDGPGFLPFRISFPQFEEGKVRAAWRQAGRDVRTATALLLDPSFSYRPTPSLAPKLPSPVVSPTTGRIKELEDARHAERVAAKEKGKKSMIYAARTNLAPRSSTPPSVRLSLTTEVSSQQSPTSPIVTIRHLKRPKRITESDDDEQGKSESDEGSSRSRRGPEYASSDERRALAYFNTTSAEGLQELTGCTPDQAQAIIELRPFDTVDGLREKLGQQGKKKGGTPKGVSSRMFDDCVEIFRGYGAVDDVLAQCERIGGQLNSIIASWSQETRKGKERATSNLVDESDENGALSLVASINEHTLKDFLSEQPTSLSKNVQLKGYQLLGLNWLRLLYKKGRSCILADEMGLGKTVQVISFFAHLKENGKRGPHLIVVPSSTLENWVREFAHFAPSIAVQTYYGGKDDRPFLRQTLLETLRSRSAPWEVLITTYTLATGDDKDRKFLRKIEWDTCVFDEGHVLKNFDSQRYQALMRNKSGWRLLLTGTPLQNNLQELVSLMNFILPDLLEDSLESLRAVFKAKGNSKVTLLAQERVSRAKKMMTPFVLRRRKDQVLKDLPKKIERIEWCEMTSQQRKIYNDALNRSRKTIFDLESEASTPGTETPPIIGRVNPLKKPKASRTKDKLYLENSSNVLMDLRKAASHPMLFRTRYTDKILDAVTRVLLKEADFKKRGAVAQYVKEDMEVMTDAELQLFLGSYLSTQRFLQDENCYLQAGKVQTLLRLLKNYQAEGRRMLIFSQFTQILDILQAVFKMQKVNYLLLTGATAVDVRQSLVDEFNEDESIPCFLLSTKAGGMGINLTAASVVILFDQDFNPHNDKQAQDRAYRIGQKRDVDVVKLITRNSIEEDMLRLGQTKLALDEAVAGDGGGQAREDFENKMKTSLMSALRKQLADAEVADAHG